MILIFYMVDEYEEIQHLREMRLEMQGKYNQIFIPLSLGTLTLFIVNLPGFIDKKWGLQYLIIGGLILTLFLTFWRITCLHIDKQIVESYPRLLEIESEKEMELQSIYFFHSLNNKSKNMLASILKDRYGRSDITCDKIQKMDYRQFKKEVEQIDKQKFNVKPQDLLLEIWDSYKNKSVTSRGHFSHNIFAILIVIGYFILVFIGQYLSWWQPPI